MKSLRHITIKSLRRATYGWTLFACVLVTSTGLTGGMPGGDENSGKDAPWNVRDHIPLDEFVIQGHRGAGELEAENTIEAFQLAWKLNTVPEADVRATRDGVIVAYHDADFRRLVKNAGPELEGKGVEDLNWSELSRLDVGSWKGEEFAGRRVPRMADVFRAMTDRPERRIYLDIKEVDLEQLAAEVDAARVGKQMILASTKYELHRQWKRLVPESGTLLWMGGTEEALSERLADLRQTEFADVTQLQIHVRPRPSDAGGGFDPSPEFLRTTGDELRTHGILFQTLPWGSADPKLYRQLLDLGVASFATDHPQVTREAIRDYYERRQD
ncbi:MAG: glycerophosphodiester phosphodiesterase family protein [Planctomycetaceae bacterium]